MCVVFTTAFVGLRVMGLFAFKGRNDANVVISSDTPPLSPSVKELVVGHSKCYGDCICIPKEFFPSLALVACDIHIFSLPCTVTAGRQSYGPRTQLVVRRVSSESRELLLELGHGRQLQHPDAQWFQILKSIPATFAESSSLTKKPVAYVHTVSRNKRKRRHRPFA